MFNFDFKDKVALVTGAGNGMGKCTALTFAKLGASVVVADINIDNATKVRDEIRSVGALAEAVQVNVTQEEDAEKMVAFTIEKFGQIDFLINCAGVSKNMKLVETTVEDWERIFAINVKGTFLGIRATLPHMIKQQSGKIINFSSMTGKEAFANAVAYCSSKFAVMGITQGVAKEVAKDNINVNAVCPGVVMTDMMHKATEDMAELQGVTKDDIIQQFSDSIPLNRLQTPEDIAGVVAFLCSDLAVNMTGQGINVTGGAQLH
ncbi:SDR family NAD(P)-dependent oxidoreductase [Planococcus sp. 1R117A]|uniref:SDR family NAD(P)-dependent oxidoreductase n=1 Tax=Planococcus sp. 1R117A TaxID=3447020 RepID=UPI003EDCACEB